MPEKVFGSIFGATLAVSTIAVWQFFVCIAVALALGAMLAGSYVIKTRYTKSFIITLALLPAVVCVVIMLVNGNIGAGVAVAGAFGLIRFRSAAGTAKEIVAIFLAMCVGLMSGMGFVTYAVLFTVLMCIILIVLNVVRIWDRKRPVKDKVLRITIPEDLNYTEVFDDIFKEYTEKCEIVSVKTTNMGSMFKLTYNIVLKDPLREKQFLDELRCRNGNLEISISIGEIVQNEL